MHKVLVNRLGGLSLPRKSVVRLTERPDMTLDVYRGRKTTMQQQQQHPSAKSGSCDNLKTVWSLLMKLGKWTDGKAEIMQVLLLTES